jgi:2-polyprenyl-3-methyl-5-hydroxy-6-metoxy-1,4-benzoquinol methylase
MTSAKCIGLQSDSCVLDYGCGPGRVAKGLIEKYGCRVVGVDFSQSMRLLAPEYVLSERFTVWSPQVLEKMTTKGFRATHAICCWVIQHVVEPHAIIQLIANAMQPAAPLYLLNQIDRCVPTDLGWVNDGIDIRPALRMHFGEIESHRLPPEVTTVRLSEASIIQVLKKLH